MKRRRAYQCLCLERGARLHQGLSHLKVPVLGRNVEGSKAVRVRYRCIRSLVEENPDNAQVRIAGSTYQRGKALRVALIDVEPPARKQGYRALGETIERGMLQLVVGASRPCLLYTSPSPRD